MKANIYEKRPGLFTILKKAAWGLLLVPASFFAQTDLVIGLNYAYDPPSGCDNKIKNLSVDICNNGSAAAGSFEVGIYLYDPSSSLHWIVDSRTVNSLNGNACITLNNWNIDMNSFCCLPAPGSNYRIGAWADTAGTVSESNKNNNASLLSGNISICAAAGVNDIREEIGAFSAYPNPLQESGTLDFTLKQDVQVAIRLYDINGKMVRKITEGKFPAGRQQLKLNTAGLGSGLYYLDIMTPNGSLSRKIAIQ